MRVPWATSITLLLAATFIGSGSVAVGWVMSRLAKLSARQNLCDEVCIAMASGPMTAKTRAEILNDAKSVLTAEEYKTFQTALDRLCPAPKKKAAKHPSKYTVMSHASATHTAKQTAKPSTKLPAKTPATLPEETGPVMPTGAVLPDRMVPGTMIQ